MQTSDVNMLSQARGHARRRGSAAAPMHAVPAWTQKREGLTRAPGSADLMRVSVHAEYNQPRVPGPQGPGRGGAVPALWEEARVSSFFEREYKASVIPIANTYCDVRVP